MFKTELYFFHQLSHIQGKTKLPEDDSLSNMFCFYI